jgi:FkbM family methyltransferase
MSEQKFLYAAKLRPESIDGVGPWVWPANDTGAWDGPVDDWVRSHRVVLHTLKKRKIAIQAGGNCGLYPALMSQMFEEVFTFEPDAQNFYFLRQNTDRFENVYALPYALGDTNRTVSMTRLSDQNVGMHIINENPGDVTMIRIDDVSLGENVEIDLIWLDLEGYEYLALIGAKETIGKHLPMIGVERATPAIIELLRPYGYKKFTDSMMDTFFVHESKWP